jgi:hypothetical protein
VRESLGSYCLSSNPAYADRILLVFDPWRSIVPEEDAWVYSPAWQERLRDAEADLAAGRVRRFADDNEFLGHLDAMDDEAGG